MAMLSLHVQALRLRSNFDGHCLWKTLQRIRGFLKWYALYKSTFYLLTYLLTLTKGVTVNPSRCGGLCHELVVAQLCFLSCSRVCGRGWEWWTHPLKLITTCYRPGYLFSTRYLSLLTQSCKHNRTDRSPPAAELVDQAAGECLLAEPTSVHLAAQATWFCPPASQQPQHDSNRHMMHRHRLLQPQQQPLSGSTLPLKALV